MSSKYTREQYTQMFHEGEIKWTKIQKKNNKKRKARKNKLLKKLENDYFKILVGKLVAGDEEIEDKKKIIHSINDGVLIKQTMSMAIWFNEFIDTYNILYENYLSIDTTFKCSLESINDKMEFRKIFCQHILELLNS
jgi:hypothetical protein